MGALGIKRMASSSLESPAVSPHARRSYRLSFPTRAPALPTEPLCSFSLLVSLPASVALSLSRPLVRRSLLGSCELSPPLLPRARFFLVANVGDKHVKSLKCSLDGYQLPARMRRALQHYTTSTSVRVRPIYHCTLKPTLHCVLGTGPTCGLLYTTPMAGLGRDSLFSPLVWPSGGGAGRGPPEALHCENLVHHSRMTWKCKLNFCNNSREARGTKLEESVLFLGTSSTPKEESLSRSVDI